MDDDFRNELLTGAQQLGISLDEKQLEVFARYESLIEGESNHTNLVSASSRETFVATHVLDSLSCLAAGVFENGMRVVDIGSGAGLPGIPIAIAMPELQLTLLEGSAKRCGFLGEAVKETGIAHARVVCERAEAFGRDANERKSFDIAVGRAVAPLPALAEYALPLVKAGGWFIAQRGKHAAEEAREAEYAVTELGGVIYETRPVNVPRLEAARFLVMIRKVRETPERYPRRIGVPLKRPLKE